MLDWSVVSCGGHLCHVTGSWPVWCVPTCPRRSVLRCWMSDVQVRQYEWHMPAVPPQLHGVSRLHWSTGYGRTWRVQLVCTRSFWRRWQRADDALLAARHQMCRWLLPWHSSWTTAWPWRRKTGKLCFIYTCANRSFLPLVNSDCAFKENLLFDDSAIVFFWPRLTPQTPER